MYDNRNDENDLRSENRDTFDNRDNYENREVFNTDAVREEKKNYSWETPVEEPLKKKKSGGVFRKILVAACCGLCFGLFAGLGLFAVDYIADFTKVSSEVYETTGNEDVISNVEDRIEEKAPITNVSPVSVVSSDYADMVEEVMPAMVSILNTYVEEINYWGQSFRQENQSGGSGIIIAENEKELLIATNNHVVADATKLEVTFIDGSIAEAQIKGTDADMDLAVIAIPLDSLSKEVRNSISIAEMGDSDALRLGEPVVAIGNALGYGQSVTGGYISALNRELELSDGSKGTFIQTDAAINHGNSGGALLNIKGEVIGINSNKISGSAVEGMGYAIPISAAEPIIGDLMLKEIKHKVEKAGYIGIENPITVPDDLVEYYNFPKGVFIRSVAEDSPAAEAGILSNDIIVKFDGTKIKTFEDLQEELQYYGPGSEVVITIMRQVDGEYVEKEIQITLGIRPDDK